jgi:XTP/dITP diphosphohydrolase
MRGEISQFPRGENGFGLDSIFVPEGYTKTWGEMTEEEQNQTSVRKLALKKLQEYLRVSSV